MVDLIQEIGPILGIVAFLGFAVLAFLIFQQAREVRRLREWAGRAPERAEEAAEASVAAAEARGEQEAEPAPERSLRERIFAPVRPLWARLDAGSPLDPRYIAAVLVAAVIAVGVLTSGFGLLEDGEPRGNRQGERGERQGQQQNRPREVAVLNATQVTGPDGITIQGVPGLADEVAEEVVRPARGFRPGIRDNAASGFDVTTIMFEPGARQDANRLAAAVEPSLGETPVEPMIQEVRDLAGGASLAIVVGQDDAAL